MADRGEETDLVADVTYKAILKTDFSRKAGHAIAAAIEKWKAEKEARLAGGGGMKDVEEEEEYIYAVKDNESDDEMGEQMEGEDGAQTFIAHVPVPSQKEIEEALVRRKKMELLQKYTSESLMAQSEEAKALLGL